jgi:hypothetical protein
MMGGHRQYAREHRDEVRRFAQMQRTQGIAVPSGRASGNRQPGTGGPTAEGPANRGYGYGGRRRFGIGMRGGTAWIGILIALLALRFLLVDSFVGTHAAIFWVLGIGGIPLGGPIIPLLLAPQEAFQPPAAAQPAERSGWVLIAPEVRMSLPARPTCPWVNRGRRPCASDCPAGGDVFAVELSDLPRGRGF